MGTRSFVVASMVLWCATCTAPTPPKGIEPEDPGARLYLRHCAICHGAAGDADTVICELLLPRPNPFRQGLFKLVSTTNGMPTEDDLVTTLRRGMPGSTMMSWDWMGEPDLRALARYVRGLAIRGRAESIHQTAAVTGRRLDLTQATAIAERELLPGPTVAIGQTIPPTAATLAQGEQLFLRHCAACHGEDGRGLPQTRDLPTDGTWLWPRDFTAGYLRGDASHAALASRILAGMPGAHMPNTRLAVAETEALVAYVQSLIPEEADRRHVQWRRSLRVARVERLPQDDAGFAKVDAVRLPLTPLWWRQGAVDEVWLRAVHDGAELAVQLQWADATEDDRAVPGRALGDGVAVQFTHEPDPPLFAMGSHDQPVNVWRWHAFDPRETAGITDLLDDTLHARLDSGLGLRTVPRVESTSFHGLDSVAEAAGGGLPLSAKARWADGRWTVTFRRALAARSPREVDLTSAQLVLFAVAVWDGTHDAHAGSKAITTWHSAELAR
ncbi:MAG: c-type cytochrome [Planctomycetes bacterium]|nr:c-type cytochrome [Planctomycetota bacterium]MCB9885434.1 c-type cytochrome [Planctomycetota bacterium]